MLYAPRTLLTRSEPDGRSAVIGQRDCGRPGAQPVNSLPQRQMRWRSQRRIRHGRSRARRPRLERPARAAVDENDSEDLRCKTLLMLARGLEHAAIVAGDLLDMA
jgi:hypothetical protein